MTSSKKFRSIGSKFRGFGLGSILFLTACSSDQKNAEVGKPNSIPSVRSPFSVKIFINSQGHEELAQFQPVDVNPVVSRDATQSSKLSLGLKKSPNLGLSGDVYNNYNEKVSVDLSDLSVVSGWMLLYGAANECNIGREQGIPALEASFADDVPWASGKKFIFSHTNSCEENLAQQEALLCVADKLSQISDAVGSIRWENVSPTYGGPWTIPVQSEKDKFIVRDLAIYALSQLGYWAVNPIEDADMSCSKYWTSAAFNSENSIDQGDLIFGETPYFQPPTVPFPIKEENSWIASSFPAAAVPRLLLQTHIFRGAGRLLKEMVEKSVYADMAGAASQRSHATDPLRGSKLAWGYEADDNNKYNTLAHAIRVLAGRWELATESPSHYSDDLWASFPWTESFTIAGPDKNCGGLTAAKSLNAFGDLVIRAHKTGITSPNQQLALSLIESAGIVLPESALEGDFSLIRAAIKNQILASKAEEFGYIEKSQPGNPPPEPTPEELSQAISDIKKGQGALLEQVFDSIPDGDLRFALGDTWSTYQLILGGDSAPTSLQNSVACGLGPGSKFQHPDLIQLGGVALDGGLLKADLTSDSMARASGVLEASQCEEISLLEADSSAVRVSQDAFAMGQIFREQLLLIHDAWKLNGWYGSEGEDGVQISQMSMAELGNWAGAGKIETQVTKRAEQVSLPGGGFATVDVVDEFRIITTGFKPKDWGVKSVDEMKDQLVLVAGHPWLAECVAKLRKTCPSQEILDSYIAKPDLSISRVVSLDAPMGDNIDIVNNDWDGSVPFPVSAARSLFHSDGTLGFFKFVSGNPSNFIAPLPHPNRGYNNIQVFAVLLHDPESPVGKGKILGSLAIRDFETLHQRSTANSPISIPSSTFLHVSPLQRKLLNNILGISEEWATSGNKIQKISPSHPLASCIEGLPNDLFVPLENELTSDSDQYENSWRHYLNLAKQAATNADALGREYIDVGLQKELRREAAGEVLGDICGNFGALDKIETKDGEINTKKPADDQGLQNCLNEKKIDLVFLGQDPFENGGVFGDLPSESENPDQATKLSKFKEILNCNGTGSSNSLCQASLFSEVSHAGLNMVKAQPAKPADCADLADLVPSLLTGFDGARAQTVSSREFLLPEQLANVLQTLKLTVDMYGDWSLLSGGVPVLSSKPSLGLWPYCRTDGQSCPNNTVATHLDKAFRIDPSVSMTFHEASAIRWRLEGALWSLAALVGGAPSGLFEIPVPISRNPSNDFSAPPETFYGTYIYSNTQVSGFSPPKFELESGTQLDEPKGNQKIVQFAYKIPNGWLGELETSAEVPDRIRNIYSDFSMDGARSFLHLPASNVSVSKTKSNLNSTAFLSSMGAGLSGIQCNSNGKVSFVGKDLPPANANPSSPVVMWVKNRMDLLENNICFSRTAPVEKEEEPRNFKMLYSTGGYVFDQGGPSDGVINLTYFGFNIFAQDYFVTVNPDAYEKITRGMFPGLETTPDGVFEIGFNFSGALGQVFRFTAFPDKNNNECWSINGFLKRACLNEDVLPPVAQNEKERFTRRILWPTSCSPDQRANFFVNSHPSSSACQTASNLTQTMMLACVLSQSNALGQITSAPNIKSQDDIPRLVSWIQFTKNLAQNQASSMFLEKVPARIIEDFNNQKIGSGDFKGQHGTLLLEFRSNLDSLLAGWFQIIASFEKLSSAIEGAHLQIQAANLAAKSAELQANKSLVELEIQQMQIHASMANTISGIFSACSPSFSSSGASFSPISCVAQATSGAMQVDSLQAQLKKVDSLKGLTDQGVGIANESSANQIQQALFGLQQNSLAEYTAIQQALISLRQNATGALSKTNAITDTEIKAQYEAAKGAGVDFVKLNGQVVQFPVNTVLNRQYGIAKVRYEKALHDAKSLAFVARKAIEQRIGIPLNAINEPVGTVEAPSSWADDVCKLQGLDYEALRSAKSESVLEAFTPPTTVENFADQYIGDYVNKLENFVEHYNIAYPSHDGDDVAVLSLRDDLLGPAENCMAESPNLLYYSGHLEASDSISDENGSVSSRGWVSRSCDVQKNCIRVAPGTALGSFEDSPKSPGGAIPFEFTWVYDLPVAVESTGAGGAAGAAGTAGSGGSENTGASQISDSLPGRSISQSLHLIPGVYVLSWWDQARGANGEANSDPEYAPSYTTSIFSEDGYPIEAIVFNADPGIENKWSVRRKIPFQVKEDGVYTVSFRVNPSNVSSSFLLGATQLEKAAGQGFDAGPYFSTNSSRLYLSSDCKGVRTPQQLQSSFVHRCEDGIGCYYELLNPISIDTTSLSEGSSFFNGKLAAGNFNYRHINLALNLAGTGVVDCSSIGTSSCYSSGYVEYSMFHDAFGVGILNYNNQRHLFSFGSASINHAKALTAEKYITNPIGSADLSLINQPSIQKPEFRGRPLDGSYRLRIWDSPSLRWDRLDDIQVVLTYRYWSPITKQAMK